MIPVPVSVLGFDFVRDDLWPALLAAAVLLGVGAFGLYERRREREALVGGQRLATFMPGFSRNRARLRLVLATVGMALLGLSLMGPVRGYTEREVRRRGLDLVLCIDTSNSMLARDVRPSRLARAKREVVGLLDQLAGDRVAIVAFSGDAREVAPLTHDRTTLEALLRDVGPRDNRKGGTDLGIALEKALDLFDGRTGNHEAIVVLTDGEDLEGRGLRVAQEAADQGIRVYVVGVATEAGGKIPIQLSDGSEGFLQQGGAEVVSRLESSTLEAITEATGGLFLSTEQSPTPLEYLFRASISNMDRQVLSGGLERIPHDRFQWTLVLGLACMLVEAGLRERRPRSQETSS